MAFAALVLAIVSAATPGPAGAQDDGSGLDPTVFDVVQVSGFVDRIVADFIETSIERAERDDVGGLILQVNSTRSVLDDDDLIALSESIADADVPVYAWVGPSGADARGKVAGVEHACGSLGGNQVIVRIGLPLAPLTAPSATAELGAAREILRDSLIHLQPRVPESPHG